MTQAASLVKKSLADLAVDPQDINRIVQAGIAAGSITDDTATAPVVSMDDFKAALADVAKSVAAMQTKAPEAKPAAAAAPAEFFEDSELTAKFDAHAAEQDRRYNNVAKGLAAIGGLLQQVVSGIAKMNEQQTALAAKQTVELEEVKKSLNEPNKPKSMQTAGGSQEVGVGKTESQKREAVHKAIQARKAGLATGTQADAAVVAQASALFSAFVPADEVATILGIQL